MMQKIAVITLLILGLCASPGFCAGITPYEPFEWDLNACLQLLLAAHMVLCMNQAGYL